VAIPTPAPAGVRQVSGSSGDVDHYLQHLSNPDEKARMEAVLQLGRVHAAQAVEPMSQVLTSDHSPMVREAAARGLGLIGTPAALPALQQAAQADEDREVRNSARFAVDVIRSHTP
jgi:HEAT repeat protein